MGQAIELPIKRVTYYRVSNMYVCFSFPHSKINKEIKELSLIKIFFVLYREEGALSACFVVRERKIL